MVELLLKVIQVKIFARDELGKRKIHCMQTRDGVPSQFLNGLWGDTNHYITCWPRQIRGPALKGRNMKGLGMRYLCRRSSRNRSGSNSRAIHDFCNQIQILLEEKTCWTNHLVPKDPIDDALQKLYIQSYKHQKKKVNQRI